MIHYENEVFHQNRFGSNGRLGCAACTGKVKSYV